MRKMTTMIALMTGAVFPIAFQNSGWKMDGDKIAVDGDGNPIFVNASGQEQSVKGDTITNLNNEAKGHRTAKEKAEGDLAKYRDESGKLIDPDTAKKAITDMAKIDAKQLIDAGKVDEVREQMRNEFTSQLTEKDKALSDRDGTINSLRLDRLFDSSAFIREKVAIPPDVFRDSFAKYFKPNDKGEFEAFDRSGNPLFSKKNVGEPARGDEAFELLIDMHPQKDSLLRAQRAGGSGNEGGGGNRGGGRTMKRSDFDALDPGAKAQAGVAMGKNELTIVDD